MLRCKNVADALAAHRYWNLPWLRRAGLRLHVTLCFVCGRYHRDVMTMQRVAAKFGEHETESAPTISLPEDAKQRIATAMQTQRGI